MSSGIWVFRVKLKDREVVGISVDMRANTTKRFSATLVLDLVSTVGNVASTSEGRTDVPPTTLYLPISRRWSDDLDGVVAVVDTTKAVLHARSRSSVPSGSPGQTFLNVETSARVEQKAHTTDGLDPTRKYYAVVHFSGIDCMQQLILITSCV